MLKALLVLVPVSAAALVLAAARPAPLVGGGAVIELQHRLFAALDAGDAKVAAMLVAPGDESPVSALVLDREGRPLLARGTETTAKLLARMAEESKNAGGAFTTKILSSDANCAGENMSYGVFEYERTHVAGKDSTVQRYQATTITRWMKEGGMKILRMHVSELPQPAQR